MAEKEGFEPSCRLHDKLISSQPRYGLFGTSPYKKAIIPKDPEDSKSRFIFVTVAANS